MISNRAERRDSAYDIRRLVKAPIDAALVSNLVLIVLKALLLSCGVAYVLLTLSSSRFHAATLYTHYMNCLVVYYNVYFMVLWILNILRTKTSAVVNSKKINVYIVAGYFRAISVGCSAFISINNLVLAIAARKKEISISSDVFAALLVYYIYITASFATEVFLTRGIISFKALYTIPIILVLSLLPTIISYSGTKSLSYLEAFNSNINFGYELLLNLGIISTSMLGLHLLESKVLRYKR